MSTITKSWKVIKPHVPLIQFKKAGRANPNQALKSQSSTTIILDDTDLPPKYQRKPITELEMQTIETGGVPFIH